MFTPKGDPGTEPLNPPLNCFTLSLLTAAQSVTVDGKPTTFTALETIHSLFVV